MFSESSEGLRHCHQSLLLSPLQLFTLSDGPPTLLHICTGPASSLSDQICHFSDLLNNADASQHLLKYTREGKTCILALLHFISITLRSRCCLEPIFGNRENPCHTHTAGVHCGTTLLNNGFADLKEETQPLPVIHVSLEPLGNTVNMVLSSNWSRC